MSPFCDYGGHLIEKGKMCSHIVFLQITQYDNIIVIFFFTGQMEGKLCWASIL